jgi:hypothetical protein
MSRRFVSASCPTSLLLTCRLGLSVNFWLHMTRSTDSSSSTPSVMQGYVTWDRPCNEQVLPCSFFFVLHGLLTKQLAPSFLLTVTSRTQLQAGPGTLRILSAASPESRPGPFSGLWRRWKSITMLGISVVFTFDSFLPQ